MFKKILGSLLVFLFAIVLTAPTTLVAATTPSLGAAATYGILSSTYTNTSAGTTVNGDIGFTTGPAVAPLGTHANYGSGSPYSTAGVDQGNTLSALAAQVCTFNFPAGAIDLSTDTTHGSIGVYSPGVYCSSGAMNVGGPITLNGSGTYIFRSVGALNSTAGAIVTLSGASVCDVFWTPSAATTLAANTTFYGTVISNAGITIGANTSWTGRALAFGGTVTTDTDNITAPSCTVPVPVEPTPIEPTPTPTPTP
ncbi:MAG: ice-binding family protein, partial [Candidatus Paceibacterota bacterium]